MKVPVTLCWSRQNFREFNLTENLFLSPMGTERFGICLFFFSPVVPPGRVLFSGRLRCSGYIFGITWRALKNNEAQVPSGQRTAGSLRAGQGAAFLISSVRTEHCQPGLCCLGHPSDLCDRTVTFVPTPLQFAASCFMV